MKCISSFLSVGESEKHSIRRYKSSRKCQNQGNDSFGDTITKQEVVNEPPLVRKLYYNRRTWFLYATYFLLVQ